METNVTRKLEMDGNVLYHRMNADGTVTLYAEGVFKQTFPKIAADSPDFFEILTDPEDDGPLMVVTDPKFVTMMIILGEPKFGFSIAAPEPEECAACETREECPKAEKEESVDG